MKSRWIKLNELCVSVAFQRLLCFKRKDENNERKLRTCFVSHPAEPLKNGTCLRCSGVQISFVVFLYPCNERLLRSEVVLKLQEVWSVVSGSYTKKYDFMQVSCTFCFVFRLTPGVICQADRNEYSCEKLYVSYFARYSFFFRQRYCFVLGRKVDFSQYNYVF